MAITEKEKFPSQLQIYQEIFQTKKKRDGEDYTSVTVSIIRVELVRDLGEDEDEIVTLVDYGASPLSLDLLNLENSAYQLVGDENIPAGTYTQIRLIVEAAAEHESQPVNPATFVLLEGDEEQRPVYVPSGSKTGLKINLNPNLELGSGQTFDISLDFNSRNSVHQTGNNDRFILRSTSMSANLTEVIVETPEEGSTEEEATE